MLADRSLAAPPLFFSLMKPACYYGLQSKQKKDKNIGRGVAVSTLRFLACLACAPRLHLLSGDRIHIASSRELKKASLTSS